MIICPKKKKRRAGKILWSEGHIIISSMDMDSVKCGPKVSPPAIIKTQRIVGREA